MHSRLDIVVQRRLSALGSVAGVRESKLAMLERALASHDPPPALLAAALYGIGHCDGGDAVRYAASGEQENCRRSMLAALSTCAWAATLTSEAIRRLYDRNARISVGDELTDVAMATAGILSTAGNEGYKTAALSTMQELSRSLNGGVKSWTRNPIFNLALWLIDPAMRSVDRQEALKPFDRLADAWVEANDTAFQAAVEDSIDAHFTLCEYSASRELRIAYAPFDAMPLEVLAAVRVRYREKISGSVPSYVGLEYADMALADDATISEPESVRKAKERIQRMVRIPTPTID